MLNVSGVHRHTQTENNVVARRTRRCEIKASSAFNHANSYYH